MTRWWWCPWVPPLAVPSSCLWSGVGPPQTGVVWRFGHPNPWMHSSAHSRVQTSWTSNPHYSSATTPWRKGFGRNSLHQNRHRIHRLSVTPRWVRASSGGLSKPRTEPHSGRVTPRGKYRGGDTAPPSVRGGQRANSATSRVPVKLFLYGWLGFHQAVVEVTSGVWSRFRSITRTHAAHSLGRFTPTPSARRRTV